MMEEPSECSEVGNWQEKVRAILGKPSTGWAEATQKLTAAHQGFHRAIADELKSIINARLVSLASATDQGKKQAIDEIREFLTKMNLAIVCPATKQAASLYAISPSYRNKHVQFWVKPRNAKSTTFTTIKIEDLIPIELVESQQRLEGISLWHQRIKNENGKPTERSQ